MSADAEEDFDAVVYRSYIDNRVWVPTMVGGPGSIAQNEACSSLSLRRVKAHVEAQMGPGVWERAHEDDVDGAQWIFRSTERSELRGRND